MKNALISPIEIIDGVYWRIAQVEENSFDVAPPLYWTQCEDYVTADGYIYNPETQQIEPYNRQVSSLEQPISVGTQQL